MAGSLKGVKTDEIISINKGWYSQQLRMKILTSKTNYLRDGYGNNNNISVSIALVACSFFFGHCPGWTIVFSSCCCSCCCIKTRTSSGKVYWTEEIKREDTQLSGATLVSSPSRWLLSSSATSATALSWWALIAPTAPASPLRNNSTRYIFFIFFSLPFDSLMWMESEKSKFNRLIIIRSSICLVNWFKLD